MHKVDFSKTCERMAKASAPRAGAQRGATLLEVLIVAVVLLVGMYTVVRVFPVGFDVVQRGDQITLASRYAQTLLDDLAANPQTLPDGILPAVYYDPNGGWQTNEAFVRPTDLDSEADSGQADEMRLRTFKNSFVQFRKIHQETTRIPRPDPGDANYSQRYCLRFSPIEYYSGKYYDLLTVYSLRAYYYVDDEVWAPRYDQRYRNRDGYYTIVDASNNAVDDEDTTRPRYLLFSGVNYERRFKIDCAIQPADTYSDETLPSVQRITDKILIVPASASGDPVRALDAADNSEFTLDRPEGEYIWGSAVIRRTFRPGRDANDAYWFEMDSSSLGVLRFNPALAGTPVGIDYSVLDWQILHDDVDAPMEADPGRTDDRAWVKLSFPYIDTESIGVSSDPRPEMQQAIIIQNIDPNSPDYGKLIDAQNASQTWTFEDLERGTDESLRGRLGLLVSQFNQASGPVRRIRIYYRTVDGFAAQVIKPFTAYTPTQWWATPPERDPSFNRYVLDRQASGEAWLIFALADVGNAVSVDYTYMDGTALRKVVGEMHTIQERRWNNNSVGYISLNVPLDNGGNRYQLRSVDSVRGMSLQVRVAWAIKGTPNRMYKILSDGWGGVDNPTYWADESKGRLQVVSTTAAVAKPRLP